MKSQPRTAADQVLRATRGSRIAGWVMLLFGVAFGLSGFAGDLAGGIMVASFGAFFAGVGLSVVTARAFVSAEGLSYRNGFRHVSISAEQVSSVEVGPGSGAGYARVAVIIGTSSGRRVRLTALQGPSTERSRSRLEAQADLIRSSLDLRPADE